MLLAAEVAGPPVLFLAPYPEGFRDFKADRRLAMKDESVRAASCAPNRLRL
jgi:hypothetical protein